MREFVNDVTVKNSNFVNKKIWYEDTTDATKGKDYDFAGRMDLTKLKDEVVQKGMHFFIIFFF